MPEAGETDGAPDASISARLLDESSVRTLDPDDDRTFERIRVRSLHEQRLKRLDLSLKLRTSYGGHLLRLVAMQTAFVDLLVLLQGSKLGGFAIEEASFRTFLIVVFVQIAALVLVVTKSLFPHPESWFEKLAQTFEPHGE